MVERIALLGFGEAAQAFAGAAEWRAEAIAYDIKTDHPSRAAGKLADYANVGVKAARTHAELRDGPGLLISLVTADQAVSAAEQVAAALPRGSLYLDLNSVAPVSKQAAASAVERAGSRYVDVAVMAPVHPGRLKTPLLISGPDAGLAAGELAKLGFSNLQVVGETVGQASAIKMIRSVIVKGMEALVAEAMLAADAAGVQTEVLTSLDNSERQLPWEQRADYALDRMIIHGSRRASEMVEAVKTLEGLCVDPILTRGTVQRQRQIGDMGLGTAAAGLAGKLIQIRNAATK